MYGLVRTHVAQVTRDAEQLAREPLVHSLASATVDLAPALLASAVGSSRAVDDAGAGTRLTRGRGYVPRRLTEPGPAPGQVAPAHANSVRQRDPACSAAQFSLEQGVIQRRLEGARTELVDAGSRDRSIAMVARRWGFTDPSYFSRRFRQAFGLTPRDWRRLDPSPPAVLAIPVPRSPQTPRLDGRTHVRRP